MSLPNNDPNALDQMFIDSLPPDVQEDIRT